MGYKCPKLKKYENNMAAPKGHKYATGRPKGSQNKATSDIKALAQEYTVEAIEKLADLMRSGEQSQVVPAITLLLAYAHGKPRQQTDMTISATGEFIMCTPKYIGRPDDSRTKP